MVNYATIVLFTIVLAIPAVLFLHQGNVDRIMLSCEVDSCNDILKSEMSLEELQELGCFCNCEFKGELISNQCIGVFDCSVAEECKDALNK